MEHVVYCFGEILGNGLATAWSREIAFKTAGWGRISPDQIEEGLADHFVVIRATRAMPCHLGLGLTTHATLLLLARS